MHVCRKRLGESQPIPWSQLRREVTREARAQLREIEGASEVLPGPDVQMILIGKALMLFSKHYGQVLAADGTALKLDEAMERILVLVREVRGEELPLPGVLQDADSLTQLALLHVVGKGPWSRDDLHKELRGYSQGPAALLSSGLVRQLPTDRMRLEAVPAMERGASSTLSDRPACPLVDKLHLLLAGAHAGRPLDRLMHKWRGQWPLITDALDWLTKADPSTRELARLCLRQVEALGPDPGLAHSGQQLGLFGGEE